MSNSLQFCLISVPRHCGRSNPGLKLTLIGNVVDVGSHGFEATPSVFIARVVIAGHALTFKIPRPET